MLVGWLGCVDGWLGEEYAHYRVGVRGMVGVGWNNDLGFKSVSTLHRDWLVGDSIQGAFRGREVRRINK